MQNVLRLPRPVAPDHQVAVAYAGAVGHQPARGAQMRQELIAWLRQRDAACTDPAGMNDCLTRQLSDRLAALAQSGSAVAPAPAAQTVQPQQVAVLADPDIPPTGNPPPAAGRLDASSLPASEQSETLVHVTSPSRFAIAAHSPGGSALQ